MYITPDLFGGTPRSQQETNTSNCWASMADSQHAAGLGKRKRHDAADGSSAYESLPGPKHNLAACPFYSGCLHQQRLTSKYSSQSTYTLTERRPAKQLRRLNPRATLVKSTSHLMETETEPAPSRSNAVSDLRSCHACQSAPKRNKDLENYLDCRRCEGRTCYICARQCYGGCGKAVCKKCIVEVGKEGDPWCLDCYARNINT
jgi:hypothetical protein